MRRDENKRFEAQGPLDAFIDSYIELLLIIIDPTISVLFLNTYKIEIHTTDGLFSFNNNNSCYY